VFGNENENKESSTETSESSSESPPSQERDKLVLEAISEESSS